MIATEKKREGSSYHGEEQRRQNRYDSKLREVQKTCESYKAEFDGFVSSVLSNVDYMNTVYSHHELETIRAAVRTIGRLPKN
jgi:hypothetical protein